MKKNEETAASDAFDDINFVENHRFYSLPRQRLFQAAIAKMKNRLIECDHLAPNEEKRQIHLLNLYLNHSGETIWEEEASVFLKNTIVLTCFDFDLQVKRRG